MYYWVWFGTEDSDPEMDSCILETQDGDEAVELVRQLRAKSNDNVVYVTCAEEKE